MKTETMTIEVKRFENGDKILSYSNSLFYVETTDGVMVYNEAEMLEIYDYENN